jgi:hypothetical protein
MLNFHWQNTYRAGTSHEIATKAAIICFAATKTFTFWDTASDFYTALGMQYQNYNTKSPGQGCGT